MTKRWGDKEMGDRDKDIRLISSKIDAFQMVYYFTVELNTISI